MEELEAEIVAPKSGINDKATDEDGAAEQQDLTLAVVKESKNETAQFDTKPEETHSSTHNNDNGQPSPANKSERRVYDRDFLITLRDVPSSRIKPTNLLDLVDAQEHQSAIRGLKDLTFKDVNLGRHNFPLFPESDEFRPSPRGLLGLKRGMQEGRPRSNRSPIILPSYPMREDFELRETKKEIIKLRETDNPWRRGRAKSGDISKRDVTAALFNRVRGILNKIMPQKVYKLGNQVKALNIHSQIQLQGVVDLIFEKAVDESKFVVAYALMCKELVGLEVSLASSEAGCDDVNFKKFIIARCLMEFEEAREEDARFIGLWDSASLGDQRKAESQPESNEERDRFRIKFFGIIGFIGELFKHRIFESFTVHRCIRHLLTQMKDESLECLCKLLGSVGKDLESENETMNQYFGEMLEIVNCQKSNQIGLRVHFMLQDVIELRANKWSILKRDTETIDPSADTEAEKEGLLLVCHQSDVQLREIDNPWRRGHQRPGCVGEGDSETNALHKSVQGLLNKLTPQKFNTLVNRIRSLKIDTQERLRSVTNLVFDYAIYIGGVTKPNYSTVCAVMCKELAMMQVSGSDTKAGREASNVDFRKLIITRCQMEFEKNTVDENARAIKMEEIEACPDPDKKKELLHVLNEEERKIRVKFVSNIRFIGELFKQGMLTTNIMHRCIRHLLTQIDEESLECLCTLLSTIGKDLESKGPPLDGYFKQILKIVNRKRQGKVSSRVRFMLQDVVELRLNKWTPRRDDSNPKTMNQIQKEAETERLDTHLNNSRMNTPRRDDRNSDRKRNRGGGPTEEGGWKAPVRSSRTQYSIEASKLKNKPPPMDNLQIGNKNVFQWSRNVSADASKTVTPIKFAMLENLNSEQDKRSALLLSGFTGPRDYSCQDDKLSYGKQSFTLMPPPQIKSIPLTAPVSSPVKSAPRMTEEQLTKKASDILEEYLSDTSVKNAASEVRETFDHTTFANFVREILNDVVGKSATARKQVSQLMTHLLFTNILPLPLYLAGLAEALELAKDLVIDIPKIWVYVAELIWYPLAEGVHPFSELKTTMAPLKSKSLAGKLMGELMIVLIQEKTPTWIEDKWDDSGLQWSDFMPESESQDFIKKYKLEFLFGDSNSSGRGLSVQLNMKQIHERLRSLISNETEYSFENVVSWISANVGERAKEPQFIRVLMTAILEVSIEPYNQTWKFKAEKFENLQNLIYRYIDSNDLLELNCLIAIQEYTHKLEHPSGVLLQVIEKLSDATILSDKAFLAWESNKDPTAQTGKSVAMMALTSFFTSLKDAEDDSTSDEA